MAHKLDESTYEQYFASVAYVAKKYGYHSAHVRKLCDGGFIKAWKSEGVWIIYTPSLEKYMKEIA